MLFLFLIPLLLTQAAPIPVVEYSNTYSSCKDIDGCRTLLGIVWSCITTIFLCTWVAIHPNIPEPVVAVGTTLEKESAPGIPEPRVMKFWHKLNSKISASFRGKIVLFIGALLAPEGILAWAVCQRIMVRQIVKDNRTLSRFIVHTVA
jgi:hypothetical protein